MRISDGDERGGVWVCTKKGVEDKDVLIKGMCWVMSYVLLCLGSGLEIDQGHPC